MTTATDVNLSQCEHKTEKGRRCKLEAGHAPVEGTSDGHRYVLRDQVQTPKPLSEIVKKGFTLTMERVPEGEHVGVERARDTAPRDEFQLRVDSDTRKAYAEWVEAGKPVEFEKAPVNRYVFPAEAFDTIVAMLRRATAATAPKDTASPGKVLRYRRKAHVSGNAMIYFVISDKVVRETPKP